jgi:hypothetical protein
VTTLEPPSDAAVPELSILLGEAVDEVLSPVLAELGVRLVSSSVMQVRYVPGRSVTV